MRNHLFIGDIIDIIAEVGMSLITVFICGFGDFFFDHTKEKSLICKYCSEFFNLGKKIVENRVMQQYVKLNKAGRKKILDMMGDFSQLDTYQAD